MPSYDEDLSSLDDGIRRLKIEYDIFFNGHRKRPPDDLRMRVERLVKRMSEATDMSFTQRFRYNTLIARFCVYRDKWRRTQQDRESARSFDAAVPHKGQTPPVQPETRASGLDGIEISIRDPGRETDKIRQLYQELLRMRGNHSDGSTPSYKQFSEYITDRTKTIRQKHQCAGVKFRISGKDKAIRFTAKADSDSSG